MKNRLLENAAIKTITGLMCGIMGFLTIVSLLFRSYIDVTYQEIIYYRNDNVILALLFLAGILLLGAFGWKKGWFLKIGERQLLIALLIYIAMISGGWAYFSHSFPVADQASILECVDGMLHGDYSCMNYKGYLQYNRHQVGITMFYELFTRIFTGGQVSYQAVYVLNVIMIVGIFLELYLITKKLCPKKEVIILELLLSFCMFQLMLYSTFVYGLIPGLFFALAGIWFLLQYLENPKWYWGLLMAFMLSLAVVMKSNYLIFVIAAAGVLTVKAISSRKLIYLLFILLMFLGFAGMNHSAQKVYENRSGIEFGDTIPNSAYLAMGMQDGKMAPGWFNGYNHVTYRKNGYNEEATDKIAKEYISERIGEFAEHPLEALRFYYYKIVSQWNEVTYECFWISTNSGNHTRELAAPVEALYRGRLHTAAEAVMNLYQLLMFAGTMCLSFVLLRSKDVEKSILLVCILGGFLFHILWEGKSQYIISYFPLMLPCTAWGIGEVLSEIIKREE